MQFESIYYLPKIYINGHQLVLCLEEVNKVVAAVVQTYTNPHHTHLESQPGIDRSQN